MQRTAYRGTEVELGVFPLNDIAPGATGSQRVRDIAGTGVVADQAGLDVSGVVNTTPPGSRSPRRQSSSQLSPAEPPPSL
ncbi:hypothetical protein OG900_05540 [Streptomyces sp. NBC_00433]